MLEALIDIVGPKILLVRFPSYHNRMFAHFAAQQNRRDMLSLISNSLCADSKSALKALDSFDSTYKTPAILAAGSSATSALRFIIETCGIGCLLQEMITTAGACRPCLSLMLDYRPEWSVLPNTSFKINMQPWQRVGGLIQELHRVYLTRDMLLVSKSSPQDTSMRTVLRAVIDQVIVLHTRVLLKRAVDGSTRTFPDISTVWIYMRGMKW